YFDRAMAERVAARIPRNADTLLIGTPTVAAAMARSGRYSELVDVSPHVVQRFPELSDARVRQCRIEDYRIGLSDPDVIVLDPPWYPGTTRTWLLVAHALTNVGSIIYFSLFPDKIRPAAREQRARLLALARSIGKIEVSPDYLQYETPLFEEE